MPENRQYGIPELQNSIDRCAGIGVGALLLELWTKVFAIRGNAVEGLLNVHTLFLAKWSTLVEKGLEYWIQLVILWRSTIVMTELSGSMSADRLDPELKKYFEAHPEQNYARLADELHILIEMVFGKDHAGLSSKEKEHLKDLHDVIDFYKMRSSGKFDNMADTVEKNKDRVLRVMDTYRWVIKEVRSRYSVGQLKYVGYLLDYLEHVQRVVALYISALEKK